jgi:hypothetical protein
MVLRCTVNAQTVARATHAATEASADKDIKGLIDCRKGQGWVLLPKHLIELLRSGMAMVLFEGGEDHHSWTGCLESCSMQSRHSFGHESVLLLNQNHSEFGICT